LEIGIIDLEMLVNKDHFPARHIYLRYDSWTENAKNDAVATELNEIGRKII